MEDKWVYVVVVIRYSREHSWDGTETVHSVYASRDAAERDLQCWFGPADKDGVYKHSEWVADLDDEYAYCEVSEKYYIRKYELED